MSPTPDPALLEPDFDSVRGLRELPDEDRFRVLPFARALWIRRSRCLTADSSAIARQAAATFWLAQRSRDGTHVELDVMNGCEYGHSVLRLPLSWLRALDEDACKAVARTIAALPSVRNGDERLALRDGRVTFDTK